MEEDHTKTIDAAPSEETMEEQAEDHDAMLRLLNERMQLQWGLAIQSTGTSSEEAELRAEKTEDSTEDNETAAEASFFRLFNSRPSTSTAGAEETEDTIPRVRLQSPSSLTLIHGRSLNRILAVEDEESYR